MSRLDGPDGINEDWWEREVRKPVRTEPSSNAGLRLELGREFLVFGGRVRVVALGPLCDVVTLRALEPELPPMPLSVGQMDVTISVSAWRELCFAGAVCDA